MSSINTSLISPVSCDIPKCANILHLTKSQKKAFLDSFDVVLCDCDGVIWMISGSLPNTGAALVLLQKAGKQLKFISNNSLRSDNDYIQKLNALGVADVKTDDIVHPAKTVARYINQHIPAQPVFSLCSDEMNKTLEDKGVHVKTMKPILDLRTSDLKLKLKPIATDKVAAVVIDIHFNLTFGELARAHQYLLDDNCKLLVGATDAIIPIESDFFTLGSAGFVNILRESSNKEPIILGKPGKQLSEILIEQYNLQTTSRALFIGDNVVTDIEFGNSSGFQTLLVLTGASTMKDMEDMPEALKPTYVANGLADFIQFFDDLHN